jgi:protein-S-isoprenylcysteine O-methyltransferase Ste14
MASYEEVIFFIQFVVIITIFCFMLYETILNARGFGRSSPNMIVLFCSWILSILLLGVGMMSFLNSVDTMILSDLFLLESIVFGIITLFLIVNGIMVFASSIQHPKDIYRPVKDEDHAN